ncbi:hypothetical protein [Streptomyces sp. NPDC058268]|uniref:hypothetical protein n=1 Tax=Streptomyces sp. NPDC058268 TaxID=3346413 RepID=UPI0036EE3EE5
MPVSTVESTARYRRSRTRSRNINARPALAISTLKPHQYDLHPSCASLICPDCKTWVPITGINAKKQKLVPHDTGVAGTDAAARCQGSNRLVSIDILVKVWQRRLEDGSAETAGRRSARQHYKPLPAPAKPVTKMTPEPETADDALIAYRKHLKKCRSSSLAGRCGGKHRCPDGTRLAALYDQLKRTQPVRNRAAHVDTLRARHRSSTAWAKQSAATVSAAKTAKRSGTTVEEANNTCKRRRTNTISDNRGPAVPLQPLRIGA